MKTLFTLSFLFISIGCFAQKVNLALNLKQDSTYYLNTNGNMTIVEDIPGQRQVITTIITARVAHKVIAMHDSVYVMALQYKKMSMQMELAGTTMGFSSDDSLSSNPASKLMASVVNKVFEMLITKSGRVIEIKDLYKIYAGVPAALSDFSEEKRAQLTDQMKQSFGEKAIRTNFQEAFEVFPAQAVAIGDQWQNPSSMESVVSYKLLITLALRQIKPDALIVHGDGVLSPNGKGEYKLFRGMQMRMNHIEGTASVDLKLDPGTCWISEGKATREVKGIVEIKDSVQTPGGITFPMSVSSDMTVTDR